MSSFIILNFLLILYVKSYSMHTLRCTLFLYNETFTKFFDSRIEYVIKLTLYH